MTRLWRVHDRSTFAALRREGVRRRVGPLTFTRLEPAAGGARVPAVAFAIGRPVGTAVARNRLRRRLRALIAEIGPEPGTYLVTAGPAAAPLDDQELRGYVRAGLAGDPTASPVPA